jgi:hypothetical protein
VSVSAQITILAAVSIAAQSTVTPTANRVRSTGAATTATSSVNVVAVKKWELVPVTPETWTKQPDTAISWTANTDTPQGWTPKEFPESLAA